MPAIQKLSSEVIRRIAAGEVVDRPASALKELLENAIDAGATQIRVNIVGGGIQQLTVEDNGCGMTREDLELCLERHATSKISKLEDLDSIFTLGFRGEALAAIASVSRLEIETAKGSGSSWKLQSFGSLETQLLPGTRSLGTKVSVSDLFFNVPARKKFLKRASQEAAECVAVLEQEAAAHPEIAMEWYVVDEAGEVRDSAQLPIQSPEDRFLYLVQSSEAPLSLERSVFPGWPGLKKIKILALPPPSFSRTQKDIRLIVNGRPITDKSLAYGLREAYAGLIEVGYFPRAQIYVEIDPVLIDVNIHPQKKEIRWPQGFSLTSFVFRLLRPSLERAGQGEVSTQESKAISDSFPNFFDSTTVSNATVSTQNSTFASDEFKSIKPPDFILNESKPTFKFAHLRVVGEVGAAWLICEAPEGLVLIDQHAAHERVQFENICSKKALIQSKPLLFPFDWELPLALQDQKAELIPILKSLGFDVDSQSTSKNILLTAVPIAERALPWETLLEEISDLFQDNKTSVEGWRLRLEQKIAASLACHGSVRRGQRLSQDEIVALLKSMDEISWGGFCPHGRPVWKLISHESIEALFHR